MACQHFPDDQTLHLQTGAGEDDIIHLPSGLDRVDYERQEEGEDTYTCTHKRRVSERAGDRERGGGGGRGVGGGGGERERERERERD